MYARAEFQMTAGTATYGCEPPSIDERRFGEEFLRLLREGPPWPTLDTVTGRLDGL
jgi:hypothetical protein